MILVAFGLHSIQVKHTHIDLNDVGSETSVVTKTYADNHHHEVGTERHSHSEYSNTSDVSGGIKTQAHSESLAEKMHLADKKVLIVILAATLFFFGLLQSPKVTFDRIQIQLTTAITNRQRRLVHILYSYIRQFYSNGLLNPKSY